MSFTREQYEQLKANLAAGKRLRAAQPERAPGVPLVGPADGKTPGHAGAQPLPVGRYRIFFEVYSQQPADWDNYTIKQIQDCLVLVGLLPDDDWKRLECGGIVSRKAAGPAEEKTVITIEEI